MCTSSMEVRSGRTAGADRIWGEWRAGDCMGQSVHVVGPGVHTVGSEAHLLVVYSVSWPAHAVVCQKSELRHDGTAVKV